MSKMYWFLLQEKSSWCIVHEKNILQAGSEIKVGDSCKFFYQGAEYLGTVCMMDADHDVCNEELKRLKKESTKRPASRSSAVNESELTGKRRINAVEFYGAGQSSNGQKRGDRNTRSKITEEEKKRQRILTLNKKEAEKRANKDLIAKLKKNQKESDEEWVPGNLEDDTSQDSVINDLVAHGAEMKANRQSLIKGLNTFPTSSPLPSPTKEDLKRDLEMMKMKLQMVYDSLPTSKGSQEKEGQRKSVTTPEADDLDDDLPDIDINQELKEIKKDAPVDENASKSEVDGFSLEDSVEENASKIEVDGNSKNDSVDENLKKSKVDGILKDDSVDENVKSSDQSDNNLGDINLDEPQEQVSLLYGKLPCTTELCRGIYCKTDVLTKALTNSSNVNHLIRRLMAGVFVPSKVLNCTVSGQSWKAGGAEKAQETKIPLHQGALKAIVDFSNGVAKKKKWPTKKFEKCKAAFSGKLIEIKNQVKEGKLKD